MRYSIVLFTLWPGDPCEGWTPGSSSLSCEAGPEGWTTLRKSLYRLYFTEGNRESSREVVALTEELTEYAGKPNRESLLTEQYRVNHAISYSTFAAANMRVSSHCVDWSRFPNRYNLNRGIMETAYSGVIGACPLGYITARMTSLQLINAPSETENTFDEVKDLLRFIDNYSPPDIVSSG
ncbi:hypothetical protein FOZ63_013507 [Perkinsus olseni]|uniref:Uncharacterized protein n=1 Tax=Perkinsus olseni TaxID=32597 RepID=A0A7J6PZ97_PEROL|nr:hypothetical protein FOZ63_013507 [Perkinsus olseni]